MSKRGGVTLTEVLVAIFIMGIGLLSLIALFPIGALNMAAAIKDERTADAARNAAAIAKLLNIRDDDNVFPRYTNPDFPAPLTSLPVVSTGSPSYPVYIDPRGFANGSTRIGVLPGVSPGFARWEPTKINTPYLRAYWTTVLDEMVFDEQGAALLTPPVGGMVQREPRYSFAFLCRQVQAYPANPASLSSPPYSTPYGVSLSVVVYDRRPNFLVSGVPVEEGCYRASFTIGSNLAVLDWTGQAPPNIRRGSWILDATVLGPGGVAEPHGYFYRVVNITPLSATTAELELQYKAQATAVNGVAVVMESVAEVFDKGMN